jgi:AcrR family transcriptional regulator
MPATRKRDSYHHGHLREALIDAAHQLITRHGADGFTLADACRTAGVSTAAPYRHFADRDALLDAVTAKAFELLTERLTAARDAHPKGSIEAIVAMGQAYVGFAADEPPLFHLMWGRHLELRANSADTQAAGGRCFGALLDAVTAYREAAGIGAARDTLSIAVPLWTHVHGTASLVLGRNLEAVAPSVDVDRMVESTTRAFLAGVAGEQQG